MARRCIECGIEFTGRHANALTCSEVCAKYRSRQYQKRYQSEWYRLNKPEVLAHQRRYAEQNREQTLATKARYRDRNREKLRADARMHQANLRAAHAALRQLNLV